jgi:hypothetical protein
VRNDIYNGHEHKNIRDQVGDGKVLEVADECQRSYERDRQRHVRIKRQGTNRFVQRVADKADVNAAKPDLREQDARLHNPLSSWADGVQAKQRV